MLRRLLMCIAVIGFVAAVVHPGEARAQLYNSMTPASSPSPRPSDTGPSYRYYGHHLMLADALVVGAALGASVAVDDEVGVLMVPVGYLISGPLTHGLRGHSDRALYSLALRTLLPLAAGSLLYSVTDSVDAQDEMAFVAGVIITMPIAAAIDWFGMSWERTERAPASSAPRVAPSVMVGKNTVGLVMAGGF